MIILQQKWLQNKLADTPLNLEERLEDILKTEISSSLYCVNNKFVMAMLGIFIYVFHPNWLMIRNFYLNLHKRF